MWSLVLGLGLATAEPPIQRPGDPVVWAFEWDAGPECPSRAEVIARVQAFVPGLDAPPVNPSYAELRVRARIDGEGDVWTATVAMTGTGGAGERRFSAPACSELADAVALVSAVALDPVIVARQLGAEIEAEASADPEPTGDDPRPGEFEALESNGEPEPGASSPRAEPLEPLANLDLIVSEPVSEGPDHRRVGLGLGLVGGGGWGPVNAGAAVAGLSFAVIGWRWRWQLEANYNIPRVLSLADGPRARVQAWSLGTRGCVVPHLRPVELPVCPGLEAGQVLGRGLAPTINRSTANQAWAAVVLGQGLRWPFIEQLALSVELGVSISLVRGRFLIGDEVLTSIAPVGVRGSVGLEARF